MSQRNPNHVARDPMQIFLGHEASSLDVFFRPRNVALIGATEKPGSVGRAVMANLIGSPFGGGVSPVNPKHEHVLGVKAYPSLADVPDPVDLAVIATPAATVPGIIGQCVEARVKGAIILSAGFRETGPAGAELERKIKDQAGRGAMRVIGPNCLGLIDPHGGLNASFAATAARKGSLAFVSQSGALGTAILDWSLTAGVGFSAFVSVGSMLDVGWGDVIDYLGNDPETRSIALYMESVGDARAFVSAAREVAMTKPIIVLKAGRSAAAAHAVVSHTGAMAGSDAVLDAAFDRCGVLRVESIEELFAMAKVLELQPRPKGDRLAIVTNAGGPGVLATDALLARGGALAELSEGTLKALDRMLPPHWSRGNPVDVLGDADATRFADAARVASGDAGSDGLLVILTPQAMSEPTETAARLAPLARATGKPVLASWMGGAGVEAGRAILAQAGIPVFASPDRAAEAFHSAWRLDDSVKGLYEVPAEATDPAVRAPDRVAADAIVSEARIGGETILTEHESKRLLAAYGIPVVETRLARDEGDAVAAAEALGYPVVLKLHSQTITHKSDVNGVHLRLATAGAVRAAYRAIEATARARVGPGHFQGVTVQRMVDDGYELLVGSATDPQFGPVLMYGSGGVLTELYRDRALALPPLNSTLARRLMGRARITDALTGARGRAPVNPAQIEGLLIRFSLLVQEHPEIREIDINPLLATLTGPVAVDARVVLHEPDVAADQLPRAVISPYPARYESLFSLRDGTEVVIRPIRPEDEPRFARFHESLSEHSIYQRFFRTERLEGRTGHARLIRRCCIDYDREMALVAERADPETGQAEIIAVGRMTTLRVGDVAEFALLVADRFQNQGLGTELLRALIEVGRDRRLTRLATAILPENEPMRRICTKVGGASTVKYGSFVRIEIDLASPRPSPTPAPTPVTPAQAATSTPTPPPPVATKRKSP